MYDKSKYRQISTLDQALYWLCGTENTYSIGTFGDCYELLANNGGGCFGVFDSALLNQMEKNNLILKQGNNYKVTRNAHKKYWTEYA